MNIEDLLPIVAQEILIMKIGNQMKHDIMSNKTSLNLINWN